MKKKNGYVGCWKLLSISGKRIEFMWLRFETMCWCYTINCEFSLIFVVIKVKKNRCVDYWKLWDIVGVHKIMSWKIMDVEIWYDCTLYASWLCEEKKKIKEMVVWNGNENEKTLERAKMKRKEKKEMKWP